MKTQLIKTMHLSILFISTLYLQAQSPGLSNHGAKIIINNNAYVVVTGAAGNFSIESGELYLYGNLKLTGNLVNNTTDDTMFSAIDNDNATLLFNGTSSQNIGGTHEKSIACRNLTIEAGATTVVSVGSKLTVLGDIVNNGTLSLAADAHHQATLKITGSLSGTGTYNMQAYLTAGRNWYVSSPVSGAKSSVFNAASNPMYWYDEAHGSTLPWAVVNDNATDLTPMKGYIAKMPTTGNVTFTGGAFNNNNETLTVYRTSGQAKEGFNLVGNPYPSYFNYGAATKLNIMPTLWYRTRNSDNNAWVFDTFNLSLGSGISLSGRAVNANIPPMQAFWVRVMPGQSSGQIQFDKSLTTHRLVSNNKRRAPENSELQMIRLRVSSTSAYDEAIVAFHPSASDGICAYDSPKMLNASSVVPDVYTKATNELMAINTMRTFDGEKRIPLGFNTLKANNFSISATQIDGFNALTQIKLYDALMGIEHDLVNDGEYQFQSAVASNLSRFELIVKIPGVTTAVNEHITSAINFERKSNQLLFVKINVPIAARANVIVYNAIGSKMHELAFASNAQAVHLHYPPGVYCVHVEVDGLLKTHLLVVE